jgi:hypothetical protein
VREFAQAILRAAKQGGPFIPVSDSGRGSDASQVHASLAVCDRGVWQPKWTIAKYADRQAYESGRPYEVLEFDGNLLLNEGITELLNLLIGGAATAFNNANSRIGVGDSSTAAVATQTGLQATTNKLYKAMDTGYPQVSNQTVTFRSTFNGSEANWVWNEITAANGVDDTAKNLNRKVQAMGTKASPAIWTVSLQITIS